MDLIFFTKFLQHLSVDETGEAVKRLGFDGVDLCLRPGYCVSPENAIATLPAAVKAWKKLGLTCPLASAATGWADPNHSPLVDIFRACGEAGVPFIKLGYWGWIAGQTHYWDLVDKARRDLERFAELGRKHNVCALLHTHSDALYCSNASGVMHFLRGFDPKHVAAYLDPAHLAADGEFFPMALDITRGYTRMIGVKNIRYDRLPPGHPDSDSAKPQAAGSDSYGAAKWKKVYCFLDDGLVDWRETVQQLRTSGYNGPLSYHGEVDGHEDAEKIQPAAQRDLRFLRTCVA